MNQTVNKIDSDERSTVADQAVQMTKKHKKIIVYFGVILLLLIAIGLWIFRPSPLYNINVVDERLQEIRFPLKAVEASYYLDGGSISILILNKNDNVIKLAIPIKASGYGIVLRI